MTPWLWAVFTVFAAASQTARNAMQRDLTVRLGTLGATHVRFLFGLPFSVLFLALILAAGGAGLPRPNAAFLVWTLIGAATQIGATGLMLAAMRSKSFVVTIAYTKTEPVQAALFGLVFLGDRLDGPTIAAILVAMTGVMLLSLPRRGASATTAWRPVLEGIAAGGFFALSAVGFRAAIRSLEAENFVVAASTTLVAGLFLQALGLSLFIALRQPSVLRAIVAAWRRSLPAGFAGALASQFWFLAFAIESAARVRTLALVEIFFAQIVSGTLFQEKTGKREWVGLLLVAIGCALIVNG